MAVPTFTFADREERQCFVLAFLHVQTRRVIFSPCTFNPNPKWLPVDLVMRDHDSNYGAGFDAALEAGGATPHVLQFRSPNTNAYVERFIQSIQQECLDQFIAFGTEHLDLLCKEYQTYYETERPHQSMGNRVLVGASPAPTLAETTPTPSTPAFADLDCTQRLGGLLKSYRRKAAA